MDCRLCKGIGGFNCSGIKVGFFCNSCWFYSMRVEGLKVLSEEEDNWVSSSRGVVRRDRVDDDFLSVSSSPVVLVMLLFVVKQWT